MRIALNVALILSLLYLPWWVGAIIAVCGCFFVHRFYEVIVYGVLADSFYGSRFGALGFAYAATLYTLVVFIIASVVRKRLAW